MSVCSICFVFLEFEEDVMGVVDERVVWGVYYLEVDNGDGIRSISYCEFSIVKW